MCEWEEEQALLDGGGTDMEGESGASVTGDWLPGPFLCLVVADAHSPKGHTA